jgi:hypothetical protein
MLANVHEQFNPKVKKKEKKKWAKHNNRTR